LGTSTLAWFQGDYESAGVNARRGLEIAREGEFALGVAYAHHMLADTAWMQGDLARAMALGEEAISRLLETGHPGLFAISLGDTATLALHHGDRERGEAWSAECLAICHALGNQWFLANHLSDLGAEAHDRGDLENAARHYRESVQRFHDVDDRWFIASPLAGLAAIAAPDRPDASARLLGAAAALREASGSTSQANEQKRDEHTAALARAALGDEAFAQAVAVGWELPLGQAVEEAMAITHEMAATEASPTS
jgi:hypothetical protein